MQAFIQFQSGTIFLLLIVMFDENIFSYPLAAAKYEMC